MLRNWALALRPSLSLDFLAGLNDSRITYSGGTNGTRVNSSGLIVAATTPRFDYDPVTLAARGLLVEEARTNLILNNTAMSTQNVTTAATAYTLSFYGTGTITLSGTSTAGPLVGTGAYPNRVTLTFTPTAGTLTLTVSGSVQYAQLEAGSFATSVIINAGSALTRTADSAVMTGTNFSSWYNQSEGTFVVTGDRNTAGGSTGVLFGCAETGNFNNSMYAANTSGGGSVVDMLYFSSGVSQASVGRNPANILNPFKLATSYAANDFAGTVDGQSPNTDASGTVPAPMQLLAIGSAPWAPTSAHWNGHIQSIAFYPRRLSNEQLPVLTS